MHRWLHAYCMVRFESASQRNWLPFLLLIQFLLGAGMAVLYGRFPARAVPHWLVHVHEVLPFYNMAIVIRGALSSGLVSHVGRSYAILAAWTTAGLLLAGWITSRRR